MNISLSLSNIHLVLTTISKTKWFTISLYSNEKTLIFTLGTKLEDVVHNNSKLFSIYPSSAFSDFHPSCFLNKVSFKHLFTANVVPPEWSLCSPKSSFFITISTGAFSKSYLVLKCERSLFSFRIFDYLCFCDCSKIVFVRLFINQRKLKITPVMFYWIQISGGFQHRYLVYFTMQVNFAFLYK